MLTLRNSALVVGLGAFAALVTAWYFQYALGYQPCQLCLWQRWPYYVGIPLAAIAAMTQRRDLLIVVGAIFAANAALGLYHAGIEWKLWAGPATCSAGAGFEGGGNLLQDLKSTRIVPCDSAPWRFLGLSFAGWNMMICAALAAAALLGARRKQP